MEDAPAPPRRNWFQDHPNAIIWIGLVLLIFGGIAAVAAWLHPGFRQRSARLSIESNGGSVGYTIDLSTSSSGSEWTRYLFGDDFVFNAYNAIIRTDASAKYLHDLPSLTSLYMIGPGVTDAAMEHLDECLLLSSVFLWDTRVTLDGLNYLKKTPTIDHLSLVGENATDEWLELLAKTGQLHELEGLDLSESKITDKGLKLMVLHGS